MGAMKPGLVLTDRRTGLPSVRFAGAPLRRPRFLLRDTVSRADSALTLGNSEIGGAWTVGNLADTSLPAWGVSGGQAYIVTVSGTDTHAWAESYGADCAIEADVAIASEASSGSTGFVFRRASTGNYWIARLNNAANTISLLLASGGVRSFPASTALTLADGQIVRLRVNLAGPVIRVYADGVLKITHSDSTHQTATKHGLYSFTTADRFNNFTVTS